MTQEMMYDPPTGWRYGFPKIYRPVEGETIEDTLERDGYPRAMADDFGGKHCRFWHVEEQAKPSRSWDSIARRYVEHDTTAQETFGPLTDWPLSHADGYVVRTTLAGANDNTRRGDFMQTFSARQFWPLDARQDEVHIEDIAHSLSLQCRYAGHCKQFYSVAEHSVLIANWIWWHSSPADALVGLMHDATEAYLVDMPRPVKRSLPDYQRHEAALWKVIAARFRLPEVMPAVVHEADNRIIADELVNMRPMAWHAKHDDPLGVELLFWSPAEAEDAFLKTFVELQKMGVAA